jgi:hypothetical protein
MNDGAFLKQNWHCCFVFWGKPLGSPFLFEDFIIFFFSPKFYKKIVNFYGDARNKKSKVEEVGCGSYHVDDHFVSRIPFS